MRPRLSYMKIVNQATKNTDMPNAQVTVSDQNIIIKSERHRFQEQP